VPPSDGLPHAVIDPSALRAAQVPPLVVAIPRFIQLHLLLLLFFIKCENYPIMTDLFQIYPVSIRSTSMKTSNEMFKLKTTHKKLVNK
jgi:hypothetical protein